jgi:hypothetical protein
MKCWWIFGHKWGRWQDHRYVEVKLYLCGQWAELSQYSKCEKCGKVKARSVKI